MFSLSRPSSETEVETCRIDEKGAASRANGFRIRVAIQTTDGARDFCEYKNLDKALEDTRRAVHEDDDTVWVQLSFEYARWDIVDFERSPWRTVTLYEWSIGAVPRINREEIDAAQAHIA